MTPSRLIQALVLGATLCGSAAAFAQQPPTTVDPYRAFAPGMQTTLRFSTDLSFAGEPGFRVKVYEWVVGRRDIPDFPLEGFAVVEVQAGELEIRMNGTTLQRRQGEHLVVPEGAKLGIKIKNEVAHLRGVVLIRK